MRRTVTASPSNSDLPQLYTLQSLLNDIRSIALLGTWLPNNLLNVYAALLSVAE